MMSTSTRSYQKPEMLRKQPLFVEYDTESDDEEVLFTREMVKRLDKKMKELQQSGRPDSSLSDSGMSSSSRITAESEETQKKNSTTSEDLKSPPTPTPSSSTLSPRTRDRILREIAMFGEDQSMKSKGKEPKKLPKYYFGKRLAEFNNIVRLLENKREKAIWEEKYSLADEIDKSLSKIRGREVPLKELLVERMEALEKNNLLEAQRLKNRFDVNLADAVTMLDLEKYLEPKQLKRLGYIPEENESGSRKST